MARQTPEVVTALAEDAETVKYSVDRFGYKIDGRDYRRVTTLLKGIPAPQLVGWAAKVVAETAARNQDWRTLSPLDAEKLLKGRPNTIRDERAQRGTNVHNAVEAYLKGGEAPKLNDDEESCVAAARKFLAARTSVILGAEISVYSEKHGYAGTFDLWDFHEGRFNLLDWKTSSGVYPSHAIQQVAYQKADYALVQRRQISEFAWTAKKIPWGGLAERLNVVHLEAGVATLYPVLPDVSDRLWEVFLCSSYMKDFLLATDTSWGRKSRERIFGTSIPTTINTEV